MSVLGRRAATTLVTAFDARRAGREPKTTSPWWNKGFAPVPSPCEEVPPVVGGCHIASLSQGVFVPLFLVARHRLPVRVRSFPLARRRTDVVDDDVCELIPAIFLEEMAGTRDDSVWLTLATRDQGA